MTVSRNWKEATGTHLHSKTFENTERFADKVVFWVCVVMSAALLVLDLKGAI